MERLIRDAQEIYAAAVRAAQADRLLDRLDLPALLPHPLDAFQRVLLVGAGKASMAMAGALETTLDGSITAGAVVVPHGYRATLPASQQAPARIDVLEAGHPVPDRDGLEAAQRTGRMLDAAGEADLVLVLLSGGGSALWPALVEGVSLHDAQTTIRLLLESGADIHHINTVRKHLSTLGGGWLAARAHPAPVLALVVSDVVGDDLSSIASGPTVPDPTTFAGALSVLRAHDLWNRTPASVRSHLERGHAGAVPETPKPGHPVFAHTRTHLVGNNRMALEGARQAAIARGYHVMMGGSNVTGEAKDAGRRLARQVLETSATTPACFLWGGETTVTVAGSGRGGRNQELALAAALTLDGAREAVVLLSGGTDGIDGPTDAAGAWATPHTAGQARALGLNPENYLADNDAYTFFDRLGALIRPGPTHTNVMDVQIALRRDG